MDSPSNPAQNPSSFHANSIISSLLSFPNSSPNSISSSFDRELEKALASASHDASVQENLVDRTLQLASLLLESTKRSSRKRAPAHNSSSWFLPSELTVKVKSNWLELFLGLEFEDMFAWVDCVGLFDAWYKVFNASGYVLHNVQQMCDGPFFLRSRGLDYRY